MLRKDQFDEFRRLLLFKLMTFKIDIYEFFHNYVKRDFTKGLKIINEKLT